MYLQGLPFQKVAHQVATLDAQPTHGHGILVMVTGALLVSYKPYPTQNTRNRLMFLAMIRLTRSSAP